MGTIEYGGFGELIHIDDRALAHLKVVITAKLRRQESFTLSWQHGDDELHGRSTIWVHPSIPLRFTFQHPEPIRINARWIDALMQSANSAGGITLVDEVEEASVSPRAAAAD